MGWAPASWLWLLTLPALECLDLAAITLQQHNYRGAQWGLRYICLALFHTQLSTQESYCHETLDSLGSSILVTQSSNLFLDGASRCPWQHFIWQCCSIAMQEHLVVLCVLTCYWKRCVFLLLNLFLALGMAWMRQRKTLAPLHWISSIRLSACWWETGQVGLMIHVQHWL